MQNNQHNFCETCGAKLVDNAQFCEVCGAPVVQSVQEESQLENVQLEPQQQTFQQPIFQQPQEKSADEIRIENISKFKSFASSPLVLVLAILSSVCAVINVVNFNLIPLITSVLMTIGCWLLWANSKNIAGEPTGGLKLIKSSVMVNYIVEIVVLALAALIALLLLFAGGAIADAFGEASGDPEVGAILASGLGVISFILLVVAGVVFAFAIIFYKAVLKFLNALIDSVGNDPKEAVEKAMLPAIFIFVVAGFSLLNALSSMTTAPVANEFLSQFVAELPVEYAEAIPTIESSSFLPQLLLAATNIYAGILIIIYKNKFSK